MQEDELKLGKKPMVSDWGTEPVYKWGVLHTEIEGSTVRENIPTLHGNYYGFFDELYKAIRKNQHEPVTAQDGVNVMRIIEAAIQSSIEKQIIKF